MESDLLGPKSVSESFYCVHSLLREVRLFLNIFG